MQESHVVPAFVFRWMKETSSTGFLRFGAQINKRAQDGIKRYWLCRECEERLEKWETPFASKIFHPLTENGGQRIDYDKWMLKFCVSLSWRVLQLFLEEGQVSNFTENQQRAIMIALERWSNFILGHEPHPGRFEQHFIPLDEVPNPGELGWPPNINRYFLRTSDIDLGTSGDDIIVYSKFGKFVVVGFVQMEHPKEWQGTKIHVRRGTVGHGTYILPQQFGDFLRDRSRRCAALQEEISAPQRAKIAQTMRKDLDRTANSASFSALDKDVSAFGRAAFGKPNESSTS